MRPIFRKGLLALSAVLCVIALSGCDHFAADPVAFTRVDSVPVARICLPMTISSIELKTYVGDDDYDGNTVWTATGAAEVEEGTELALGELLPGMQLTFGSDDLSEVRTQLGREYAVSISGRDARGSHELFASIDDSELEEAIWLDGSGPVDSPCVRAPCPAGFACHNQWPQPSDQALVPAPTWTPVPIP